MNLNVKYKTVKLLGNKQKALGADIGLSKAFLDFTGYTRCIYKKEINELDFIKSEDCSVKDPIKENTRTFKTHQ